MLVCHKALIRVSNVAVFSPGNWPTGESDKCGSIYRYTVDFVIFALLKFLFEFSTKETLAAIFLKLMKSRMSGVDINFVEND